MPPPGIRQSIRATCGWYSTASDGASLATVVEPTTSNPGSASITATSSPSRSSLSSTSNTRVGSARTAVPAASAGSDG